MAVSKIRLGALFGTAARAELPTRIVGRYFVLARDRGGFAETWTLTLDDENNTSHTLGTQETEVADYFKRVGFEQLAERFIPIAREFGAVQVVTKDGRCIALYDRKTPNVFAEEDKKPGISLCLP